jgi:hypothetical protein
MNHTAANPNRREAMTAPDQPNQTTSPAAQQLMEMARLRLYEAAMACYYARHDAHEYQRAYTHFRAIQQEDHALCEADAHEGAAAPLSMDAVLGALARYEEQNTDPWEESPSVAFFANGRGQIHDASIGLVIPFRTLADAYYKLTTLTD